MIDGDTIVNHGEAGPEIVMIACPTMDRRHFTLATLAATMLPAAAMAASSASERMSELGTENGAMIQRVGTWDVVETVWAEPGAAPEETKGLVAERRRIGSLLQETISLPGASDAIVRVDYVTFDRVAGCWDYVSMDTRAPVGIMPAWSFDRGSDERILLTFAPFPLVGSGAGVGGQMLRMDQVIVRQGPDHDLKQQHWVLADGTGASWLAHQYAYTRRAA